MNMRERKQILMRVVAFERPLAPLCEALSAYGWDCAEELVQVTRRDLVNALQHFVRGGASAQEIEAWANVIEGRDDLAYDDDSAELIHILANPALEGDLSVARAETLMRALSSR
jgi:hypothetical protein